MANLQNFNHLELGEEHFTAIMKTYWNQLKAMTKKRVFVERGENVDDYFQEAMIYTWKAYSKNTKTLQSYIIEKGWSWRLWFFLTMIQGIHAYYVYNNKKKRKAFYENITHMSRFRNNEDYDFPDAIPTDYAIQLEADLQTMEKHIELLPNEDRNNIIALLKTNYKFRRGCILSYGKLNNVTFSKLKMSVALLKHKMEIVKSPKLSQKFSDISFNDAVKYITAVRMENYNGKKTLITYSAIGPKFMAAASNINLNEKKVKDFTPQDFCAIRHELNKDHYQEGSFRFNYTRLLKDMFGTFYLFGIIDSNLFKDESGKKWGPKANVIHRMLTALKSSEEKTIKTA